MNIKYDVDLIRQISLFEKITRAQVKEYFLFRDKPTFMVQPGQSIKALGKNKANLLKLQKLMNKQIRIIEFNQDIQLFIKNLIAPLKITSMEDEDGIVTIKGPDTKTKGLMIGSKAKNLRETETIVKRYFPDLKEIKVI